MPRMISYAYHKQFDEAFDTGERSFAQTYLLYASTGTFHLDVDDRSWLLPPHRAALIQAGCSIRIWTSGAATSASALFAPDQIAMPTLGCQVFRITPLITEMMHYATRWTESQAELDEQSQPFFTALGHVVSDASHRIDDLWFPRARTAALRRAVQFTLTNLSKTLTFADVAQAAFTSERTLSRRFTDEFKMGWSEFVQRARIINATERLAMSQEKIVHIAHETGFPSASSFSQTFMQMMGETPTRYRKRLKSSLNCSKF